MLPEIFTKPNYEEIIKQELDMKPDDKVILKIEPEDSSYDYYYYENSNNIAFVDNEVGSKIIVSKNFESSKNLNVSSPLSTVQQGVIKVEPEIQDIAPTEKLIDIKSECHLDFIWEEVDISEDIKPYLLPVGPNVETGNENLKECGLRLDPSHDHTNTKQPEYVDNSSDSDEVDVTTVDNDFSTLFREECKKKVKRRRGRKRKALKHKRRCSVQRGARRRRPARNKGRTAQQKPDEKEAMGKSISGKPTNGVLSPMSSTSSEARARIRNLIWEYIPSTSSSSRSSSVRIDQLDERTREKRNLAENERRERQDLQEKKKQNRLVSTIAEKERRKRESNLMKDLKLLIPAVRGEHRTPVAKILTSSVEYIDELKQNLKTKLKAIKDLENQKVSLLKKFNNLIKEMEDLSLNSR